MTDIEAELYDRIDRFPLDDPTSPYPMSAKLAWEYHWSEIYTFRAMREYKKFIFLARIAEGMVAPSSTIDAVWHYHLLYTYSSEVTIFIDSRLYVVTSGRFKEIGKRLVTRKKRQLKLKNLVSIGIFRQ